MNDQTKQSDSRRKIIKRLLAGGGVVATGQLIPDKWAKPVVESVLLPAHATSSLNVTLIRLNVTVDQVGP